MKIVAFILCLFFFNKASCQFNFRASYSARTHIDFIGDSIKNNSLSDDEKLVNAHFDSVFRYKLDCDFQFRLWEYGMSGTDNVFILSIKNRKTSARYFEFERNLSGMKRKVWEKKVDTTKLDQLWDLMRDDDVLTLPDESSLRKYPLPAYKIDTTTFRVDEFNRKNIIADGLGFSFELIKPEKKRSYSYACCYQSVLDECPYVGEYYKATAIVLMIKKYLGYPVSSYLR